MVTQSLSSPSLPHLVFCYVTYLYKISSILVEIIYIICKYHIYILYIDYKVQYILFKYYIIRYSYLTFFLSEHEPIILRRYEPKNRERS